MKKKLAASLALAFTLGIAGTAFAANPFVDVPAKHWSYDAVSKLAADGIVDGYGDGSFKGDKSMTRYEMATIVAKAMAKEEKANAEDRALIQKLSAEYAQELDNLGVRVANLEKKIDNVTYNGKVRFRYDNDKRDDQPGANKTAASQSYLDLFLNAQINDNWKAVAEIESSKQTTIGNDGGENNTSKIYAVGKVGETTVTAGKFGLMSNYGLLDDTKLNGAQVDFGNKFKTSVRAGHLDSEVVSDGYGHVASEYKPTYRGVAFNYALSKDTNLIGSYHHVGIGETDQDTVNIYELGFGTTLVKNLTFQGSFAKSNIDVDKVYGAGSKESDKAYYTQLMYKAADSKAAGSFDVYAQYKKIPEAVSFAPTWDYASDRKAWQVGFDYVPMVNSKFTAFYQDGKIISSDKDEKVYRAQIELYF